MKSVLTMMAIGLTLASREARRNESVLRYDAEDYDSMMAIPADRRVKVLMGDSYSEAQIERLLKRLESARSRANQEHRNRTHLVRKEARSVHLARMYMKGTPYKYVEDFCHTPPNWERVMELIGMVSVPLVKAPAENKTPNASNIAFRNFDNWRMGN